MSHHKNENAIKMRASLSRTADDNASNDAPEVPSEDFFEIALNAERSISVLFNLLSIASGRDTNPPIAGFMSRVY